MINWSDAIGDPPPPRSKKRIYIDDEMITLIARQLLDLVVSWQESHEWEDEVP